MTITDRRYHQSFGIQEYVTPKCIVDTSKRQKTNLSGFNKAKAISIFEEHAKKHSKIPSSTVYSSITSWSKSKIMGGSMSKTKKISSTEEAIKKAKNSPGVGKYKWDTPFKIRGVSNQKSRKTTFIDESVALSKEVPG